MSGYKNYEHRYKHTPEQRRRKIARCDDRAKPCELEHAVIATAAPLPQLPLGHRCYAAVRCASPDPRVRTFISNREEANPGIDIDVGEEVAALVFEHATGPLDPTPGKGGVQ